MKKAILFGYIYFGFHAFKIKRKTEKEDVLFTDNLPICTCTVLIKNIQPRMPYINTSMGR